MEMQRLLRNAARDCDVATMRRLVAEGADVNGQGAEGWRPLHVAAHYGHVAVVEVLVELGADKNASDVMDRTAAPSGMAWSCGSREGVGGARR
jgi:ankyrin repeat protein